MEFELEVSVTLATSWDFWAHCHHNIDLNSTEGSLYLPDPNIFCGKVSVIDKNGKSKVIFNRKNPFSFPNLKIKKVLLDKIIECAESVDMAIAINGNHEPRC